MSFPVAWSLFCLGIFIFILFAKWALEEIDYQRKVCPIWSETLNALMDAEVPVRVSYDYCELGPVRIYVGDYPSDYGHESLKRDYPDRLTQKRLKEYIAYKHGSNILKKASDNLNVAKSP